MNKTHIVACMGGFCQSREMCAHYQLSADFPVERLCGEQEEPELIRSYEKEERAA